MSQRKVCPECGSSAIVPKSDRQYGHNREYDTAYRCKAPGCGAHFDDPDYRDVERKGPSRGLAGELATIGEERGENV